MRVIHVGKGCVERRGCGVERGEEWRRERKEWLRWWYDWMLKRGGKKWWGKGRDVGR